MEHVWTGSGHSSRLPPALDPGSIGRTQRARTTLTDRTREAVSPPGPGPGHRLGPVLAAGLLNTTRQLGSAVGLVTLAALAAGRADARSAAGASTTEALAAGYGLALSGAALFAGAGLVAALFVPVRKRSSTPQGDTERVAA